MLRRTVGRQFSSLSRSQFLSQRHPPKFSNGDPVKFYRVRFQRPPFLSWQRTRKWILYGTAAVCLWRYIVPEFVTITFEEVEEEVVGEDGEPDVQTEEGDEEEVEDGLFIPCGWPRKAPRTYYKASDPEWQQFLKFNKEVARHKEVQLRLVAAIRREIAALPNSKRVLGDINEKKGRFWLEIIFPDGPPQDYEVDGIEITDEFIAWGTKSVSQKEYQQLCRAMFPVATMKASWASFRYQFDMQANKVRQYFGFQPKMDPEVAFIKASLMDKPSASHFRRGAPPPGVQSGQHPKGLPPTVPEQAPSAPDSEGSKANSSILSSIVPQGEKQPVTLALFLHNLGKNRKPVSIEPPRGSVVVTGLIEVIGNRGRTTLDVTAAFDPASDEYVGWGWKPKRIQPKSQRPRGGP